MKKAILMVAAMGMVGGALAEQTTVIQPVSATVANVCTYNPDDMQDVSKSPPSPYTQGNKDLGTYKAIAATTGSVEKGSFYIFRCTVGTNFFTNASAASGDFLIHKDGTGTGPNGSLKVLYALTRSEELNTVKGDIHKAGIEYTIPASQWQSMAGNYSGQVSVTIEYN